jgi:hypothetical protein
MHCKKIIVRFFTLKEYLRNDIANTDVKGKLCKNFYHL